MSPRDENQFPSAILLTMAEPERRKREQSLKPVALEEPYASRLEGLLKFGDFATAEKSIRDLDAAYRSYRSQSDRKGTTLVRQIAILGKRRAASLARNPRVRPEKRREKEEIARWFNVWLEAPDLFLDWLELRRQSEEFCALFAPQNGATSSD